MTKRYDDMYAWIVLLRNKPSRVSRQIVLARRDHPRSIVRAAITVLRCY